MFRFSACQKPFSTQKDCQEGRFSDPKLYKNTASGRKTGSFAASIKEMARFMPFLPTDRYFYALFVAANGLNPLLTV